MSKISILKRKAMKVINMLVQGDFLGLYMRVNYIARRAGINLYSKIFTYSNGMVLTNVDVIITEKCSLKCKNCANLMQYYAKPQHIKLSQICRDIDLLMKRVDYIKKIDILGGEPLIYKELSFVLRHIVTYKSKYGILVVTTNGTIIPSDELLLEMKRSEVFFLISNYGETSANHDKLIRQLKNHKIPFISTVVQWCTCQQLIDGDNLSDSQVQTVYSDCVAAINCNSLKSGRFYCCPFLAHADSLHAIPSDPRNYVDLLDSNVTKDDMRAYLKSETGPPGCRYCSGHSIFMESIPAAEQTINPISYRVFE